MLASSSPILKSFRDLFRAKYGHDSQANHLAYNESPQSASPVLDSRGSPCLADAKSDFFTTGEVLCDMHDPFDVACKQIWLIGAQKTDTT